MRASLEMGRRKGRESILGKMGIPIEAAFIRTPGMGWGFMTGEKGASIEGSGKVNV